MSVYFPKILKNPVFRSIFQENFFVLVQKVQRRDCPNIINDIRANLVVLVVAVMPRRWVGRCVSPPFIQFKVDVNIHYSQPPGSHKAGNKLVLLQDADDTRASFAARV